MASELDGGATEAFGCVVFNNDPDATALASSLAEMKGKHFTPVVALSADQAAQLNASERDLDEFVDVAVELIAVAADHEHPTAEHAETLLAELDELVARSA